MNGMRFLSMLCDAMERVFLPAVLEKGTMRHRWGLVHAIDAILCLMVRHT